ncbi:MAG TPA: hypothetical protein VLJ61_19785 [Pyrinomonadaceae bacterium]|nr:hypothetical protein [Pyrinomonadaceae bacterium]
MGLGISVQDDPESLHSYGENLSTYPELEINEWEELFINVLGAPVEIERIADEDRQSFLARRERLFKEDLTGKGYEMLGRIWYVFRDVFYAPCEVDKLLEECLELQHKTENKIAFSGLEKRIFACHEALKFKSGIFLACD